MTNLLQHVRLDAKPNAFRSFAFVLPVPDLARNAAYFRDALGFSLQWPLGCGWQMATRDNVRIMLGHHPDAASEAIASGQGYFAYIHVDDADALHQEFARRGAVILQPPRDKPHRMREFLVGTPDGYCLMIGQTLDRT